MSFEAEFRLPGAKPYEYVNITVRGNDEREFDQDLSALNAELVKKIREIHRMAADLMLYKDAGQAAKPVANPDRTSISVATPTAEELIKTELGGTVIESTENVKPWERPRPATTTSVSLF